jgi:hypothetical protein
MRLGPAARIVPSLLCLVDTWIAPPPADALDVEPPEELEPPDEALALVDAGVLPPPAALPDDELELLLPHAATSRQPVISKAAPFGFLTMPPAR